MNRILTLLALAITFATGANAQPQAEKFGAYIIGGDEAAPVIKALKQKMQASKPFEVVTKDDVSKVIITIDCMAREKQSMAFVCMYVLHFNGASLKTFMGGGLYVAATADDVANNFLASIAQDIVDRFDSINKDNLRSALESCLMLTDTKCNVPGPLQKEFGEKQMTLGQYMISKQH